MAQQLFKGVTIYEVEPKRYDELIAKEERLRLLEEAITRKGEYESIADIKKIFNLEKEVTENEYNTLDTNNN